MHHGPLLELLSADRRPENSQHRTNALWGVLKVEARPGQEWRMDFMCLTRGGVVQGRHDNLGVPTPFAYKLDIIGTISRLLLFCNHYSTWCS